MYKFIFLVFLASWLTSGFSQAAESEKLSIVTSEYTYNVEINPQGQSQAETDELSEARRHFDSLTPAERAIFEQSRALYLGKTALLLNKNKILLGVLSGSAEFLKSIKDQLLDKRQEIPEGEIGIIVRRLMQEEADRLEKFPAEKKQLKDRGHLAIGNLLQTINRILYKQAKAVCSSDEIGISLGAGLGLNAGVGRVAAGALAELQFLFGYNRKTKAVVFEIHTLLEKMKRRHQDVSATKQ